MNVTFGNMAELIIALFILAAGATDVVKAQITGSIIGNALLGLGLAIVVGGWKRHTQTFPRERAGLQSSLLILSVIALLVPALFDFTERGLNQTAVERSRLDEKLSLGVSVVLIIMYFANIAYTLVTHRNVFSREEDADEMHGAAWPLWKSIGVLLAATAAIALEAELVSGALEATSQVPRAVAVLPRRDGPRGGRQCGGVRLGGLLRAARSNGAGVHDHGRAPPCRSRCSRRPCW